MKDFYLRVCIDRSEAIRVGNNQWGYLDLPVFPANLSQNQREVYRSLALASGADAIGVFPPIRRLLGTATPNDVPALLDELRSDRLFESKRQKRIMRENKNRLRKGYETWHLRFMQMPVGVNSDELMIVNDEVTLPQSCDSLVSFRCQKLYHFNMESPIAKIPSLDDLVGDVGRVISGAVAATDYAEIKTWIASDPSVSARLAEAYKLAAKMTLRAAELLKQLKVNREARLKEAQAKEREEVDRIQRIEQLKEQQIAVWITQYGSDNQKARYAERLLPRSEVLLAMEEQAFDPLKEFSQYDPIVAAELDEVANDEGRLDLVGGAIKHGSSDAKSVTAEEFDLMRVVKSIVPDASAKVVRHFAYYDDARDSDEPRVKRRCIHVVLKVEQFVFSRDYRVD